MIPQRPEEIPIWTAYFYSCVIASTLLGLACVFASTFYRPIAAFATSFFVIGAVFGAVHAYRLLRYHFWARRFVRENAKMPISISMDGDSGYAMVTTLDGTLVSLHVPTEVLGEGPEAVTSFVVESLEAD